jgi:hypothetical protein
MPRTPDLFGAIRNRLKHLDEQITRLTVERDNLVSEATRVAAQFRGIRNGVGDRKRNGAPMARPRRKPKGGGPSLIDLIVDALKEGSAGVADIRDRIAKQAPGRVAADNASATISSAIAQHMKGKSKRIKITRHGGKGYGNKYAAI